LGLMHLSWVFFTKGEVDMVSKMLRFTLIELLVGSCRKF